MATDIFSLFTSGRESPGVSLFAITPSDSTDLTNQARLIYVGNGGNVSVIDTKGTTVVFANVPTGGYIGPFNIARVTATNTTATNLVGFQ